MFGVNKDRVREFVDALRAREQFKCEGTLIKPRQDGYSGETVLYFCALGVACDVSGLGVWRGPFYAIPTEDETTGQWTVECASVDLPEQVRAWYGFEDSSPVVFTDKGEPQRIIALNDGTTITTGALSFGEIADAIERTYLRTP